MIRKVTLLGILLAFCASVCAVGVVSTGIAQNKVKVSSVEELRHVMTKSHQQIVMARRTYVVAPTGDNRASGNITQPLKSISEAAERAMPGDTILVKAGVYRERVAPPPGGEPGKPITYRAEALGKVFIRCSCSCRCGPGKRHCLLIRVRRGLVSCVVAKI